MSLFISTTLSRLMPTGTDEGRLCGRGTVGTALLSVLPAGTRDGARRIMVALCGAACVERNAAGGGAGTGGTNRCARTLLLLVGRRLIALQNVD